MSDYFDNLMVRSFRPLLPVHQREAPLLAPTPEVSHALAPSTRKEFEDPFAQAIGTDDQLAEGPEQPSALGVPSPAKNTKRLPPVKKDREPSETALFENPRRLKTSSRSVESSTSQEPAASSNQLIPHSADGVLPRQATILTANAGPLVGKALQPSAELVEPSKSTASTPASDVSRSEFRPAPVKKSAEIQSASPLNSSARQAVVVSQQITQTLETPALLTNLIPRPDSELVLPSTDKSRPNLLSRSPNATGAEVPPSETIINVSIGRIEVRAATPPKAARPEKQRRAPQVMNLDDYLRQRSGGSR